MGKFLNPDNSAFQVALNSEIYIDKTALLEYTNKVIDTNNCLICNSRPRRFGKSITVNMLTAYYSRGCDSAQLFAKRAIAEWDSFRQHLNQYDVIRVDVQWCRTEAGSAEKTVAYITRQVIGELQAVYPETDIGKAETLSGVLSLINDGTGRKFIILIDEWDVLIRDEAANTAVQEEYIQFLRGLFKGAQSTEFLHLAWLTGILPVKKLKTESALNNFEEFTMLSPGAMAPYIGLTEKEVLELCRKYHRDFEKVKQWYDGYLLEWVPPADGKLQETPSVERLHVYNPMAVEGVMRRGIFESYWSQSGTYDVIVPLINMNFDGLKTAVISMISGASVPVDISTYQNDMVSFANRDDVLTSLIHLGYLAYNRAEQSVFIPNEEIRSEFLNATKRKQWDELGGLWRRSKELLEATLDMDGDIVAELVEEIHTRFVSAVQYNDENSLSSVLTIAYLSAMQYYIKPIREFPTGRGFADFVYFPKPEYLCEIPALLVELKWNRSANAALHQIKTKNYMGTLKDYTGDILLVGINYNKKTGKHQCLIEKYPLDKNENIPYSIR